MQTRPEINSIEILGDSLTDRGTLKHNPMLIHAAGFAGVMNSDSFTNGYPWSDHFIASVANKFTIQQLKAMRGASDASDADINCDIADGVINGDLRIKPKVQGNYNLDNDTYVEFNGKKILRSRAIGGLTAHHYFSNPFVNLGKLSLKIFSCFFARLLLSSLSDQRKLIFKDNKKEKRSQEDIEKSLVIEWSGANDIMTVNVKPDQKSVDLAVAARIKNAVKMVEKGYRNFVLFNMPDLSLTPRFQRMSAEDQQNARTWCEDFNTKLAAAVAHLNQTHVKASFVIFDAASKYRDVFDNPEKYGFDREKRGLAFIKQPEFKNNPKGAVPSKGYMSWDDVHPTADLHAVIAKELFEFVKSKFKLKLPPSLMAQENKNTLFVEQKDKKGRAVRKPMQKNHSVADFREPGPSRKK